jgi:GNAT superfamily N-acetyltransferase
MYFKKTEEIRLRGKIMVEIKEVRTKKDQRVFVALPSKMYKNIPQAIPDLISDEIDNFNPNKNPAYEYCRTKQFLAYQNGRCVGRIAGIINYAANNKWDKKRIRFSRVDFIDDYEVSAALFQAVEDWGRSEGLTEIHGPIGFCDMDQEGMLVEGFEEEGMFITIYNHPYYVKHMEALGYCKDTDWLEYQVTLPKEPDEKLSRLSEAVLRRNKLRLFEAKRKSEIKPYVEKVFELCNICYEKLYGTVELTPKQIQKYYNQFIVLVNAQYVKLIFDSEDQLVGFGLAMPSLNKAVKRSNGRLFPFGWLRILNAPYVKAKVLDLYLIGVLPHMQNKGLTAVLMNSMSETARRNGIEYAETGPELESNQQVQALWKHYETRQHKRRRCWIKNINEG